MGLSDIFKHKKSHSRSASAKSNAADGDLTASPPQSPSRTSRDTPRATQTAASPRTSTNLHDRTVPVTTRTDKDLPQPPAVPAASTVAARAGEAEQPHAIARDGHLSPNDAVGPRASATAPTLPAPEFKPFSISPSPSRAELDDEATAHQFALLNLAASRDSAHQTADSSAADRATNAISTSGLTAQTTTHSPPSNIAPPPPGFWGHPATIAPEVAAEPNPSFLSTTETAFALPYSPQAHLAAHTALMPLSQPTARLPDVTHQPASLEIQRAELFDRIEREHHKPTVARIDALGRELFGKSGMQLIDPEGKGSIEWIEHWQAPVVQERVQPVEERSYETVINRELNRYHIHPQIVPITNPDPSINDPTQELHYFLDADGNWREIRGRAFAEEIIRASEAALRSESASVKMVGLSDARRKDDPHRWQDERAVKREQEELLRLSTGGTYDVRGSGWERTQRASGTDTVGHRQREGLVDRVEDTAHESRERKHQGQDADRDVVGVAV